MSGDEQFAESLKKAIRKRFSFLEERGYEVVPAAGPGVRYESGQVFFSIGFDDRHRLVTISFGPLLWSRHAAEIFEEEDLAELADPPGKLKWCYFRVRKPGHLEKALEGYAEFLKTRGHALLAGSPSVFEQLSKARLARTSSAAQRLSKRLARHTPLPVEVVRRKVTPADQMPGPVVVGKLIESEQGDRVKKLSAAKRAAVEMLELSIDPKKRSDWDVRLLGLEPHPMDYERVFVFEAASHARTTYRVLWQENRFKVEPGPGASAVKVTAFYSDWLQKDDERARRYPKSYRKVAHLLQPDLVWLAWRYVDPADPDNQTYDGLVWLDNAFAWFPRPYEALADLIAP